jgi:hypothetical protein
MRLRVDVSAPIMYGLSWLLLGVAVLTIVLLIATGSRVEWLPTAIATDVIAAAIYALLCRSLVRRFEHAV